MEKFWFPCLELEVPAPTTISCSDMQELSAKGEFCADELMLASTSSERVRPGDLLCFDHDELMEDVEIEVEVDIEDEDLGLFVAEDAVAAGLQYFLQEDDDEDDDID